MLLKITLLTIALAISGSYAHCPHHGGNIGWRNEPMWRGWGVHPAWRLSSFGDMFAPFGEDWHFYHPQHQIFSTYEYPHHLNGERADMLPEHCQREREQRESQYRLEEEQARRHELDSLNREEEELEREWQQKSEEFQREQAEFQQRKEIISQQKAKHDVRHSETTPSNEAKPRQPTTSESQQLEEQQRVASEQRRKQQAEQEAEMLQREAIKKYKQQQQQQAQRQSHARQRDRIELARHQVTGYDPDDITVTVDEERIKIEGKHICHCNEKCITREFARSYPLTIDINPDSISATMDEQGTIKISAEQNREGERNSEARKVKVEGLGIPQSTKPSVEELRTCLGRKGGIKLSKVNKRTGKVHVDDYKYDHEVLSNNQPMGTDYEEGFVETED